MSSHAIITDVVRTPEGTAIPGATVTVYESGGALATIYSDSQGLNIISGSTVTTDSNGYFTFFTGFGYAVDLYIQKSGYEPQWKHYGDILMITSDYTLHPKTDSILLVDTTSGNITITLSPTTSTPIDREYIVINTGATGYIVTIISNDTTIVPSTAVTLELENERIGLTFDGTYWRAIR